MSASRPILATWHRRGAPLGKPRHYARVTTAIPRAIQLLLLHGEPLDVIQLTHSEISDPLVDIKIHAGGRITIKLYY